MATLAFVTPEDHAALLQEFSELKAFVGAFINSIDDDVDTATAMRLTGIKSRTTLLEVRGEGEGQISYRKNGTRSVYSRKSCIAFKLRRLGGPITTLRIAS